jgi:NAD(P)-dependent dehydrogenase (short-subunit alcohol dehydrogenase family)
MHGCHAAAVDTEAGRLHARAMTKPSCAIVGIGPKNGSAFARGFAAAGYRIALLSRSTSVSERLAAELGDAKAYACDVADPASVSRAFAAVRTDFGDPEVLIYNAGSGVWKAVDEVSAAEFELSWRVNALGALVASQQVLPAMRKSGRGNIVFVGATASLRGKPKTSAFAAAKAAQRSLAQSMARQFGPEGIHVSLMIIDGQIGDPDLPLEAAKDRLHPKHIADAALALTRQPASAWSFEIDLRPQNENW